MGRVATTLAFVAALHVAVWLSLGAPRLGAIAEHPRNPQPIAIELLAAPAARPPAQNARAMPADRRRPSASSPSALAQRTPPQVVPPQQAAAAPASQLEAPPVTAPAGAPRSASDWLGAIDGVGADRSFRYRSNAERAAAQAGAARPIEQRTADDELTRRTAQAAKTDCRTAHANMGLLALPMLAYDALDGSTCRW